MKVTTTAGEVRKMGVDADFREVAIKSVELDFEDIRRLKRGSNGALRVWVEWMFCKTEPSADE